MERLSWTKIKHWLYRATIGWLLIAIKKVLNDIKSLGWKWGAVALLVSLVVFYSPTIVLLTIYGFTGNQWCLTAGIGYVLWWFGPVGSPGLGTFSMITIGVVEVIKKLK